MYKACVHVNHSVGLLYNCILLLCWLDPGLQILENEDTVEKSPPLPTVFNHARRQHLPYPEHKC